mmetsp:Transcript_29243/g.61198  ORF Transcript_29243/g.61198 Transcript_29243/m.61198 type:complete len:94 (-) Transcript_29243:80-361(-)
MLKELVLSGSFRSLAREPCSGVSIFSLGLVTGNTDDPDRLEEVRDIDVVVAFIVTVALMFPTCRQCPSSTHEAVTSVPIEVGYCTYLEKHGQS